MLLRDDLLALLVALDDRFGHQQRQELGVLLALLDEQLFLDRQTSAHLVESLCQFADLVARLDGHVDVVVACADALRARLQSPDGPHEELGEEHRGDAHGEDDADGRQHDGPGERGLPLERLRGVDLADDGPVQFGVGNRDGGVGQ